MAGVPQRGIDLPEAVGSAAPPPYVSADSYGAGLGAEIERAGNVLHQDEVRALRAERQRQEESANASAGLGAAKLKVDLTKAAQASRDAAPLDGSGHADRVGNEADALIKDYLGTITDKRVRERWQVQAAEMKGNLVADEDGWQRGRRIGAIVTNGNEASRLWNNQLQGDPAPDTLDQAMKAGDAYWDGIAADAETKDKGRREWKQGNAYNYGHGLAEKDPAAAIHVVESGLLDQWVTPEQKKALLNEAQTNQRIAEADARRVQSQAEALVREDVTEFKQRVDRGELPSDAETAQLTGRAQALGLTNLVDDIGYSTGKLKMSRITDKWTSAEWETNVNSLAAKVAAGKASAAEQQELNILQELRGPKEARFRNDPDGYASASGMPAPQVDLADPKPADVAARKNWARSYARSGGLVEPPYLGKDQLAAYRDRAAQGPVGQLEAAAELRNTWGMDAAPSIVRQIGGEAKSNMLIMLGLNDRMAQVYRRGHEALDKKAVKLDDKIVAQQWQRYLPGIPADVAPALLDTARNITAGWMLEQGKTEPTADFADVFSKAVHRAAGMLGSWGEGSATGGFANWNGRPAWLPQDMSRGDFQARLARAAPDDWARASVDSAGNPASAAPHHLGANGKPVAYKPEEIARFGKGTLQTVAPGIYHLVDPSGGTVVDGAGRAWQFDVRRLPRNHMRARAQ